MDKVEFLNVGYVSLISTMGDDLEVANAARVSFDKRSEFDAEGRLKKKDQKLIDFLWKEEHTSPFRHCVLSFEIYAPLMVARQHWKYAVASTFVDDQNGWNESSRRYITEEPAFYIPTAGDWRSAPENSKQGSGEPINYGLGIELTMRLFNMIEAAEKEYQHALELGVCPEQARLFLPAYGMYVRYRWTTSLHGIMNFLNERLGKDAQVEIQEMAKVIKELSEEKFPYCIGLIK